MGPKAKEGAPAPAAPAPAQAQPRAPEAAAEESWDEEKLEASLKRLQEYHIKVRNMRTTIPQMIQPLYNKPYPPPEVLFASVDSSMKTAYKDVNEFRQLMTSEEAKEILDHASQSRKENPKGIKPWRARDDPDWIRINSSDSPES